MKEFEENRCSFAEVKPSFNGVVFLKHGVAMEFAALTIIIYSLILEAWIFMRGLMMGNLFDRSRHGYVKLM